MRAPEWDSNLQSVRQYLMELRWLAVDACSVAMAARIAFEASAATSRRLIAEADRVLALR